MMLKSFELTAGHGPATLPLATSGRPRRLGFGRPDPGSGNRHHRVPEGQRSGSSVV